VEKLGQHDEDSRPARGAADHSDASQMSSPREDHSGVQYYDNGQLSKC
jgi:hypothetical protein